MTVLSKVWKCYEGHLLTKVVTKIPNHSYHDKEAVLLNVIRTKVSVCMSDMTTSNIVKDKDSNHIPLESNQHGKTLAYEV